MALLKNIITKLTELKKTQTVVNQTPEQLARDIIDNRLIQAGWVIQNYREINLGAGLGIAVREHPTDSGPADYVLYVNRQPVGVIEAKKDQSILTAHELTRDFLGLGISEFSRGFCK